MSLVDRNLCTVKARGTKTVMDSIEETTRERKRKLLIRLFKNWAPISIHFLTLYFKCMSNGPRYHTSSDSCIFSIVFAIVVGVRTREGRQ